MSQSDIRKKIDLVRQAAASYYVNDDPIMSDAEYDALVREIADAGGPDLRSEVAGGTKTTGKFDHDVSMLSLANVFTPEELGKWADKVGYPVSLEPKYDGAALSIHFRNGIFVRAVTRGDGITGEDVTAQVALMELPVRPDFTGELRGEVVLTRDAWASASASRIERGKKPFVNPRNGAAGLLRSEPCAETHLLSFCQYEEIVFGKRRPYSDRSVVCKTPQALLAALAKMESDRHSLPFDTDGAVIKVVGGSRIDILGEGSSTPKWAVAFKFAPEEATTRLLTITTQVGRTGAITPVASIEPTFVGGTTIESVTLHNFTMIEAMDLRPGDRVFVRRAGEVIPQITGRVEEPGHAKRPKVVPPTHCPECGSPVDASQTVLRCSEPDECPAAGVSAWIIYAASKAVLDLDGVGSSLLYELIANGALSRPSDLFKLRASDFDGIPGVGQKTVQNFMAQTKKAMSLPAHRYLLALNIRSAQTSCAKIVNALAGYGEDLHALFDHEWTRELLEEMPGFGQKKIDTIMDGLVRREEELRSLLAVVRPIMPEVSDEPASGPYAGKSVVVTGKIVGSFNGSEITTRDQVHEVVVALGGEVGGSVSGSTSILIAGENAGSKIAKAQKLGVTVMTFDEFLAAAQ